MAASAGTVTLDLDANSVKLLRELQKSQRATERTAKRMESSMSRSFKAISRAAITAGAALGAAFAVRSVRSIAQAGIELDRLERGLRVASGSVDGAARDMAFLRKEAERLGLDLRSAGQGFVSLSAAAKGTALEGQAARDIFTAVSEASRVMGLSTEQTGGALTAIEQMISKGTVSAEELRGQLGERLPGAFQIAARSMGVTTEELDKMLRLGQVSAADMLPKLARELRRTFGPEVEAAANDAQAAFARFQTAIFELQASIAESGLLDSLAELANMMSFFLKGGSGFGADSDVFEEPIRQLTLFRNRLEAQLEGIREGAGQHGGLLGDLAKRLRNDPSVEMLENQLASVTKALENFRRAQIEALTGGSAAGDGISEVFSTATKRASDYGEELEKLQGRYKTTEERIADLRFVLERFGDDLTEGQRALIKEDIVKLWGDGLEEITIDAKKRFTAPMKAQFDQIDEASKQAARNIQDAFADFLFDPFAEGLKGMLKGFLDIIRRMLAEQAAFQLFSWILGAFTGGNPNDPGGHIGAGLNDMFPGRAHGGPVMAGGGYMVGEQGPEFFSPSRSGMIIPNNKLSSGMSVSVTNNISADGFTEAQLAAALDRNTERTVGRIYELRQKGRL